MYAAPSADVEHPPPRTTVLTGHDAVELLPLVTFVAVWIVVRITAASVGVVQDNVPLPSVLSTALMFHRY